jgi:hypothetical protein
MKRVSIPIAALLCLLGLWAPRAFADTTTKPYAVDVAPHPVAAGSTQTFTATFSNETKTQQIGSANLTVPAGFSIVSAANPSPLGTATVVGSTIQLRSLSAPPGTSVTVSVVAISPCTPGDYPWVAIAKQSNNFSGDPGNDLTFDAANSNLVTTTTGTCSLGFGFLSQPADAQKNTNITSERYLPTGAPVQVQVLDANGAIITSASVPVTLSIATNPGGGVLTSAAVNAVGGIATFPTLSIDKTGLGYTLAATTTAASIDAGESSAFDIVDVGKNCPAGPCQSGTVTNGNTSANELASAGASGDQLTLVLSVEALDCVGYTEVSAVVTFDTTGTRTKTITITIPKSVGGNANSRQVCFSSPTPFTDRFGATVTTGLLPDCTVAPAPCTLSSKVVQGNIVVMFSAPAGDPKGRV